jgi:hypothetical protein
MYPSLQVNRMATPNSRKHRRESAKPVAPQEFRRAHHMCQPGENSTREMIMIGKI